MLLRDAISIFVGHVGTQEVAGVPGRNREANTIDWYQRMLRPFVAFAESECGPDPPLSAVTAELLNGYKTYCKNVYAVSTTNGHLRAIKAMLNAMVDFGFIEYSPGARVKRIKQQNNAPKGHPTELVMLLREVSLTISARVALVVHLVTITGARASEIANLRWCDLEIHGDRGRATVIGKGEKERTIFFGQAECELLRRYQSLRTGFVAWYLDWHPEAADEGYLFWGNSGRMGYAGVRKDFLRCVKAAKVELSAQPLHGCRHGFAKRWLKNGGDLKSLQDALGHSDIKTTAMYLQLTDDDLDEAHEKFAGL